MTLVRQHSRSSRAFTLLEVLIATMIFATVLVAMNAVFYTAFHLRAKTSKLVEDSIPINRALQILKRDLSGIMPMPAGQSNSIVTAAPTNFTSLTRMSGLEIFTTSAPTDGRSIHGDVQKVAYILKEPTNRFGTFGRDLVRLVTTNVLTLVQEMPGEQRLLGGVEKLQFLFFNGTDWRETWDYTFEESASPKAIKMRLEFAYDQEKDEEKLPVELVVPILMQKRTNAVEASAATTEGNP